MKFKWWHGVLVVALFLALLSPLASSSPDGLERVAENKGFMETAQEAAFEIIPDYAMPMVGNEAVATILAGIIGVLMLFGIVCGLARLLKAKGEA